MSHTYNATPMGLIQPTHADTKCRKYECELTTVQAAAAVSSDVLFTPICSLTLSQSSANDGKSTTDLQKAVVRLITDTQQLN